MERYPIISLGNQTSSSVKNGKFIFLNPTYLKDLETKKKERRERNYYQNLLFSGFKTLDMSKNYDCSRKYKSGWWYPYGLKYEFRAGGIKEKCQYDETNPFTNLNGVYHPDIKNNQRQIVLCNKPNVEDCFIHTRDKLDNIIDGYTLNHTTTIKLTETSMWLKRL